MNKLEDAARTIVGAIDGHRTIEQVALASRMTDFDVLGFLYQGLTVGAFELRQPPDAPESIPGAARSTWQDIVREAENSLSLGDLLEAFRHLRRLREQFAAVTAASEAAAALEGEIEREVGKTPLAANVILELAVPLHEVTRLNCSPDEGFVLSRVNGVYTLPQILAQLPGLRLFNILVVNSLLQRGVIKLRESQAVARYQGPKKTRFLLTHWGQLLTVAPAAPTAARNPASSIGVTSTRSSASRSTPRSRVVPYTAVAA